MAPKEMNEGRRNIAPTESNKVRAGRGLVFRIQIAVFNFNSLKSYQGIGNASH